MKPAVHDASDPELPGRYELVTIFEALHDMNHPVEALRAACASLAEGGSVLIADERVAERFSVPGDEIERLNYGASLPWPSAFSTRTCGQTACKRASLQFGWFLRSRHPFL